MAIPSCAVIVAAFCACVFVGTFTGAQTLSNAPSAQKAKTQTAKAAESAWPRTFTSGSDKFLVYQPQVDKWEGNRIDLYSAVEMTKEKGSNPTYGVVWFNARTEVDKINRLVTLDNIELTKVKFPVAPQNEPVLTALLQQKLPGVTKTISLDRLEAALEADGEPVKGVEVKNDPPKIIFSTKDSVLVLIDGPAQLREVQGTKLQRVINTKAVLLFENDKKTYYLRVSDWWLQAPQLEGPWTYAKKLPDDMKKAEEYIVNQTGGQTLQTQQATQPQSGTASQTEAAKAQPSLKEAGKNAPIPNVYVAFGPTELIETRGEPVYKAIPGTGLEYVENTNGDIFRLSSEYYVLISGRWFKGRVARWTMDLRQQI